MTQDEMQRLLIRVVDEYHWIKSYQEFLRIALDQLDNQDNKTVDRVELLLSTYLSVTEEHFDYLDNLIDQRETMYNNQLAGD